MQKIDADELLAARGLDYFRNLATFGALTDRMIETILRGGVIERMEQGEFISRYDEPANEFHVVLEGEVAYYTHGEEQDVLTRRYKRGEQMGFDLMVGLIHYNGTDVALEDSTLLTISSGQFQSLLADHPGEFGIFMINLARELSREIAELEQVIGKGATWLPH